MTLSGTGPSLFDFLVVGGGIVGLSTARALLERHPGAGVLVLEKESGWARHQTGHNSGVIHSGIYYKPGSLKARFAREGGERLAEFCREHGVAYEICGKVIVATGTGELQLLDNLHQRGLANGLGIRGIGMKELAEVEPHVAGIAALMVPSAGIVDFVGVTEAFARIVRERGGELRLGTRVTDISENESGVEVRTGADETFRARTLINCAGLYSDRVARLAGIETRMKVLPFRGEYYELRPEKRHLVRNLVYPVPDPNFPFLGVHLTRMIEGGIEAGPNAVLGLAREGYRKTDVRLDELFEILTYPAFWRLAAGNWRTGAGEVFRSLSKGAFVRGLQRLLPEVEKDDLVPAEAGVRAQVLMEDGRIMDDFLVVEGRRSVHVLNAPSPAATACLPIGDYIAGLAGERRGCGQVG